MAYCQITPAVDQIEQMPGIFKSFDKHNNLKQKKHNEKKTPNQWWRIKQNRLLRKNKEETASRRIDVLISIID